MDSIRKIETPPDIKNVIRRRLTLAPEAVLIGTFGLSRPTVGVWGDKSTYYIYIGANGDLKRADEARIRTGLPFPGVQQDLPPTTTLMHYTDSRFCYISHSKLAGGGVKFVSSAGVSFVIHDVELYLPNVPNYRINYLFVGALGSRFERHQLAFEFEQMLVKSLSEYVRRVDAN